MADSQGQRESGWPCCNFTREHQNSSSAPTPCAPWIAWHVITTSQPGEKLFKRTNTADVAQAYRFDEPPAAYVPWQAGSFP